MLGVGPGCSEEPRACGAGQLRALGQVQLLPWI